MPAGGDSRVNPAAADGVAFIGKALAQADPNVLRLALHQLTGDPLLVQMRVERVPVWGGALFTYALAPEHHATVREMALKYLLERPRATSGEEHPSPAAVRATMEIFGHGPLTDAEFRLGHEEAAFEEFPRDVQWTTRPSQATLARIHIVVVGAGICGIAAGVQLERLGIPYTIIERQSGLGGTWHANDYPEARVDTISQIYQFKFEKKYPWTELFAARNETKQYLEHCAKKFKVADNIVFNTELTAAGWDETSGKWKITLRSEGSQDRAVEANFILSASGLFSTPKLPDIPGIESFTGALFHSSAWRHDLDVTGKRVAQIGTGASGVQFAPYLAKKAQSLTIFQRTPNWVLPMAGYRERVPAELQWLFDHFPFYWNWYSYSMYFLNAQLEGLHEFDLEWQKTGGIINKRNDELRRDSEHFIRSKLSARPDLIDKVVPRYPPLARRPTVDNGWYDALLRDNVTLVTDPLERIVPTGIVTKAGELFEADVIVSAAGFHTMRYLWPAKYVGRDGLTPEDLWRKDGPRAYLGVTMPKFPNFFMFYGPASQQRAGSFYTAAEAWTRYALKAITRVVEHGKTSIECRQDAFDAYNERLDEANKSILWETHGRGFYYVSAEGRSVVNAPWRIAELYDMLFAPNLDHFSIR
jgi:4-hydroxyacetophenone monooxygenase